MAEEVLNSKQSRSQTKYYGQKKNPKSKHNYIAGVQVVWTWNETACPILSGVLYSSKPTYASHLLFLFYTSLLFSAQLVSKSYFKIFPLVCTYCWLSDNNNSQKSVLVHLPFRQSLQERLSLSRWIFQSVSEAYPERLFLSQP